MKLKLYAFLIILVGMAAFLSAQSVVPLRVIVLPPTPTVVKSGEEFDITYRAEFLDLGSKNEEIIIETDKLQPTDLFVFPFEAVSLNLEKRKEDDVFVWDFHYRMRIIDKEKGHKKIPPVIFRYLRKLMNDPPEKGRYKEFKTTEINIEYVSTITASPALDIRNSFAVGDFRWHQRISSALIWISVLSLGLWALGLVYFAKIRKKVKIFSVAQSESKMDKTSAIRTGGWSFCSPRKAKRVLRREIRSLKKSADNDWKGVKPADLTKREEKLFVCLRDFIFAHYPNLSIGHTPNNAAEYFQSEIRSPYRRRTWLEIAEIWIVLHRGLDTQELTIAGRNKSEALVNLKRLERAVGATSWKNLFTRPFRMVKTNRHRFGRIPSLLTFFRRR